MKKRAIWLAKGDENTKKIHRQVVALKSFDTIWKLKNNIGWYYVEFDSNPNLAVTTTNKCTLTTKGRHKRHIFIFYIF
jgi:hypothetical protein